ncbi:MAG: family 78 glycoside hydrolase catalytic domain, partial [Tannerella sp.]|nr:family 78 glycoside hydrolase catalytic domain [Tannerella sp.]
MRQLIITLSLLVASVAGIFGQTLQIGNLRCEYMKDPLGIDIAKPRLSWELTSEVANAKQTAYRILVSTDATALENNKADAWDSRKIKSNATNQIYYAGNTLKTNTLYYWKVQVWDEKGKASEWSPVARFLVGPLTASDWKGVWIGEKTTPVQPEDQYYQPVGYRSVQETADNVQKTVIIDLGGSKSFEAVKIYPLKGREKSFPLRFTIETADNADFSNARTIADETQKDVTVQSAEFYYKKLGSPVFARYIRLTISKLPPVIVERGRNRENEPKKYEYGIAEFEVLNKAENIALNAPVQVSDTTTLDWKWEQRWITDGHIKPSDKKNYTDVIPPSPLLRKEITIGKKIKNAFWTTTAQGLYEAYINGKKVGNQKLAPEYTEYDSHLQYQTFEVTDLLTEGKNALGAMLADGWFAGARWAYPNRGRYGYFRKFIGQLLVNYEDGSQEITGTDGTWKIWQQGPVREASNFIGEVYDASYEQKGWDKAGYNDAAWRSVSVYPDEKWNLTAQLNEPIAVIKEIKAISVHKVGNNKYIFDIGQNMPGWARLSLKYNPGCPLRFRYGEYLYDDGTLYTDNLRGAKQIDLYIPADEPSVTYEPRFTYHGFRFVEVEGLTREPQASDLTGIVVASSSPVVSDFTCSDKSLNQLWSNVRWTLWGNLISIPTDCPQRDEREGWMADAQVFSQTAAYNLDMAGFYTKWERDIRDSQHPDGRFTNIAPHDGIWRDLYGAPGWADAGIVIPWHVYLNYNDKEIIAQSFESMRRFVDFNHKHNPDLIWRK